MSARVNVVVPMAGLGTRFRDAGYEASKPFIDVAGRPMIGRVLDNLRIPGARYVLIARRDFADELNRELPRLLGSRLHEVVWVDRVTEGAACTVLHAREQIQDDTPLLIANSDQIVDVDVAEFAGDVEARGLDGSIMTFECPARERKWSYARLGADRLVVEVREKEPISTTATAGIYAFRRGRDFVDAAVDMIARNERAGGEFYVCPVYNHAIARGRRIGVWDIPPAAMHGIGTPADLTAYLDLLRARETADAS